MREWTWDGFKPDDICRAIREAVGPGRANCVWGGMGWNFVVLVDGRYESVMYNDVVVLNNDGTITITRGATDGV